MTKYVIIELVIDDNHTLRQISAEMVELTANYVMVVHDGKYTCHPWHQIRRLECDSDPRPVTVPPPYVAPWDNRQAPFGVMYE